MDNATRLELAQNRRYSAVAKMEDSYHRMCIAERNGDAPAPADVAAFDAAKIEVVAADVEIRELTPTVRGAHGMQQIDVADAMRVPAELAATRTHGPRGLVDVGPLARALAGSGNHTTGAVVCRTLLQGVGASLLGATRADGGVVAIGGYGGVPLVQAVQVIPTDAGTFFYNKISATSPPPTGAKQAAEGDVKAQVALQSTPTTLTLATFAAWEKCSVQALDDQSGLAAAVESLLTGAVLRAADTDTWSVFSSGATAITPEADAVSTIVKTAAAIAAAGGSGIRAVVNPVDWATAMLTKASTSGNWLGLPPGVEMPAIVPSSGVPMGSVLVTAGTDGAFVALREQVSASIGLSGDDFVRNLRTVLAEARLAAGIRNAALAYVGDLVDIA